MRLHASCCPLLPSLFALAVLGAPVRGQSESKPPATYAALPSEIPATFVPRKESFDHTRREIMVPMRDDDTVLLVREYGAGTGRYELGLPKGRLDRDETAEQGAERELKEEIGYGAHELHIIANLSLSPAYMTSMAHVVLARDLYEERLTGDEPEELEVVPWKLSELHTLLAQPDITEGRSIAALFIAREYLAGRYRPVP
jgi:ADP-ribose diphosphatase